jgi:hypothetical protein
MTKRERKYHSWYHWTVRRLSKKFSERTQLMIDTWFSDTHDLMFRKGKYKHTPETFVGISALTGVTAPKATHGETVTVTITSNNHL